MSKANLTRLMSLVLLSGLLIAVSDLPTAIHGLARAGAIGGAVAVVIVGLAGIASLFDFSALFTQLHFLSFSNDLWMLDPRSDRLIQLFPLGFFFDAAVRIAVQTVALGALFFAASFAALRFVR